MLFPVSNRSSAEIICNRLKQTAAAHLEQLPARIIRSELENVPVHILSQLPERHNLAKSMRKYRRRDLPANPKSLAELNDIPERFSNTLSGEKFLIHDYDVNEKKSLFLLRGGT